ncbi:hypothetical protein [Devosia sp.]|uniref:hypothetical protein n=1 Tax=Devosia sp. TaxID=1871048 RepID=UPI003A90AA3A
MATSTDSSPARAASPVAFNLATLALTMVALGLGLAYLIDSAGRAARAPTVSDITVVTRTLSGTDLKIPLGWFRYEEIEGEGLTKQIDLKFDLPLGANGESREVDATLVPRSRVRPSAALLDGVYLHQFGPEQLSGPPGLVGKPLRAGDGFDGETVWYDPLSVSPFVAKCSAPLAEGTAGRCVRTVYLGAGIAAVYAFDDDALPGWRRFDEALNVRFTTIGAL